MGTMRNCYVCHRDLPLEDFGLNKTKPEGRTLECRDCRREYGRQWREKNRDKDREASQRWRDAHPETARERVVAWREKNDRRPQDALYRERHPDEVKAHKYRSRAKAAGALIVEEVLFSVVVERAAGACGICSQSVDLTLAARHPLSATIDHIIPFTAGGEHSYANTQLAHWACNSGKRDHLGSLRPARQAAEPDGEDALVQVGLAHHDNVLGGAGSLSESAQVPA